MIAVNSVISSQDYHLDCWVKKRSFETIKLKNIDFFYYATIHNNIIDITLFIIQLSNFIVSSKIKLFIDQI